MGIHNPLLSDAVDAYFPWMTALKNAYGQGVWPLWNFSAYSGAPFAASLGSAPFHPFNAFFGVMDVPNASTLFPFLRVILAATGLYLLLASWRLRGPAAFFGGLVYGFCGGPYRLAVQLSQHQHHGLGALDFSLHRQGDQGQGRFMGSGVCGFVGHPVFGRAPGNLVSFVRGPFFVSGVSGGLAKTAGGPDRRRCCSGCWPWPGPDAWPFSCAPSSFCRFLEYLPQTTRYLEIADRGGNLHLDLRFLDAVRLLIGTLFSPDFFGSPVHGNYWEFANYNEQNGHFTVTGLFFRLVVLGFNAKPGEKRGGSLPFGFESLFFGSGPGRLLHGRQIALVFRPGGETAGIQAGGQSSAHLCFRAVLFHLRGLWPVGHDELQAKDPAGVGLPVWRFFWAWALPGCFLRTAAE